MYIAFSDYADSFGFVLVKQLKQQFFVGEVEGISGLVTTIL